MQISLSGTAEQVGEMSTLVDAVTAAYMSEVVDKDAQRYRKRIELIKDNARRYDDKAQGHPREHAEDAPAPRHERPHEHHPAAADGTPGVRAGEPGS